MRLGFGWLAVIVICMSPVAAQAALFSFDSPAEVVLSPTQAPNVWYTDRYPPAIFASGQNGGGRTGVLQQNINAEDFDRDPPFDSAFYNTQGRKYDLAPGTQGLVIELYVPSSWDALNQIDGRLASFWATGFNDANIVTDFFPIIEFNTSRPGLGDNGFRVWDSNTGWFNVGGFSGFNQWYQLGFVLEGGQEHFFVNGSPVGSVNDPLTTQLGNVILQGYNSGNSYNISWDNLSVVPEPATLPAFALLLAGIGCGALRRRKQRRS